MFESRSRRSVICGAISAVGGGLAGCASKSAQKSATEKTKTGNHTTAVESTTSVETTEKRERIEAQALPVEGRWLTYQYNERNTSYSPGGKGVSNDGTPYWRIRKARNPVISNKTLYMPEGSYVVARNAETGALIWKTELRGGSTSPSAAFIDGNLYLTDYRNAYSIDASTGSVTWSRELDKRGNPVPVIDDGIVYFCKGAGNSGRVYALDAKNGEKRWEKDVDGDVTESVAVNDETVFVGASELHALDKESGNSQWSFSVSQSVTSPPVVSDDRVYITDGHSVYAVRPDTGDADWQVSGIRADGLALTDRSLYCSGLDGLSSFDRESGTERWHFETETDAGPPSVGNGVVYFGTGVHGRYLRALDTENGDVHWRYQLELRDDGDTLRGGINSTPVVVDGALYVVSGDGYLYAFGENES